MISSDKLRFLVKVLLTGTSCAELLGEKSCVLTSCPSHCIHGLLSHGDSTYKPEHTAVNSIVGKVTTKVTVDLHLLPRLKKEKYLFIFPFSTYKGLSCYGVMLTSCLIFFRGGCSMAHSIGSCLMDSTICCAKRDLQ